MLVNLNKIVWSELDKKKKKKKKKDSEKIRTRRRIEPRAPRCPVENFANAPHGITAVPRVI